MLAADLTIRLDTEFGTVDYALLERVVHEALTEARIPVVDVEMDGLRAVDAPLPIGLGPGGIPAGPLTLPPGAQRRPGY